MALTTDKGQGLEGVNKDISPLSFMVICNPAKPFEEYVIVKKENYSENLSFNDYQKLYGLFKGCI